METPNQPKFSKKAFILVAIMFITFFVLGLIIYFSSGLHARELDSFDLIFYPSFLLILLFSMIYGAFKSLLEIREETQRNEVIQKLEENIKNHPEKSLPVWDLATKRLQNYLDRNLSQVKNIFLLSAFVMLMGFVLIIIGSFQVFKAPENLEPGIVAAVAGLITNFIGASFLILYKSIMAQANDYVNVLERINAVGMSAQIIDTIEGEDKKLKNESKADLAKKLIELYQKDGSLGD